VRRAQTIPPRNHWALLLCRVMSAKSKSGLPVGKPRKKLTTQPKVIHTNLIETKLHSHEEELFARGIELFNTRYFFEAHEAWEEIWLHTAPPEKTFLQGLIQVTAAFHHLQRDNPLGTTLLLQAALMRLDRYPESFGGIFVGLLRHDIRERLLMLEAGEPVSRLDSPRIQPLECRPRKPE